VTPTRPDNEAAPGPAGECPAPPRTGYWQLCAEFDSAEALHHAVLQVRDAGAREYEVCSPVLTHESLEAHMPRAGSRLHYISAFGGITGVSVGLAMCVLSSLLYGLWTGGKPPVNLVPFVVVGFECTILFAALFTVAGLVYFARLKPLAPPPDYRPGFSNDRYGLYVQCEPARKPAVAELLRAAGATEVIDGDAA